jgi:hypothetical protein
MKPEVKPEVETVVEAMEIQEERPLQQWLR